MIILCSSPGLKIDKIGSESDKVQHALQALLLHRQYCTKEGGVLVELLLADASSVKARGNPSSCTVVLTPRDFSAINNMSASRRRCICPDSALPMPPTRSHASLWWDGCRLLTLLTHRRWPNNSLDTATRRLLDSQIVNEPNRLNSLMPHPTLLA